MAAYRQVSTVDTFSESFVFFSFDLIAFKSNLLVAFLVYTKFYRPIQWSVHVAVPSSTEKLMEESLIPEQVFACSYHVLLKYYLFSGMHSLNETPQ